MWVLEVLDYDQLPTFRQFLGYPSSTDVEKKLKKARSMQACGGVLGVGWVFLWLTNVRIALHQELQGSTGAGDQEQAGPRSLQAH